MVVSLPMSTFYTTSIRWCGRIIDGAGVRMDPSSYEGIRDACIPSTAGELCEYIHAIAWMSNSIPRFAERAAPLNDVLEAAYRNARKRTKRSIANIPLILIGWSALHTDAFYGLQQQLHAMVTTAHRDPNLRLCVYTDASDHFWAAAVTQCEHSELRKSTQNQKHEPLAFLSSRFAATRIHWTIYEKEAFAVVQTFRRLNYLLSCSDSVTIFTDHRNLLFTFHPTAVEPNLGRHKVLKVIRWEIYLSAFSYTIEHVPGELNTLADVMTRWMRGYRRVGGRSHRVSIVARLSKTQMPMIPTVPNNGAPSVSRSILLEAQRNSEVKPVSSLADDDGLLRINGRVWVPDQADDVKVKLLTLAHAGQSGHRGSDGTAAILCEQYIWNGLIGDCKDFVANCLLCILSRSGSYVPRPLATTLHASSPNEVLHFDYLFLGTSENALKYVLVLKDDSSGYCWILPSPSATAVHAAECLAR